MHVIIDQQCLCSITTSQWKRGVASARPYLLRSGELMTTHAKENRGQAPSDIRRRQTADS